MKKSTRSVYLATTILMGFNSFQVFAQENQSEDTGVIEELVVTARKRAENLQDIPDAITAFSAGQIEDRRLNTVDDFIALTSNVHIVNDQDAGTNIITVRGIGTNRNLASSVAFVVDGVILPDSDAFTTDLADVERVEILKGPQGALYGRNAIGGVINLTTKMPGNEFERDVKLGYGSGNTFEGFGAISGPLVEDKAAARLTVNYRNSDGHIVNDFTGNKLDNDQSLRVSGRLILNPTEKLTLDFRGTYYDQEAGAAWFSTTDILGTSGGEITEAIANTNPDQDGPHGTERQVSDLSAKIDFEAEFGTFTSITAYDAVKTVFHQDLDYTSQNLVNDAYQTRDISSYSQELRFTSLDDSKFRYIIGGYYQNTSRDLETMAELDFCFFLPLPFCPTPPLTPTGIFLPLPLNTLEGTFNQYAVFGQASLDVSEKMELSFALRYDRDERKQRDLLINREDEAVFDDIQPKVSLAYKANEDVLLYATFAEGYKSGAFNPPPPDGAFYNLVVNQETSQSFELGFKSTLAEQKVQLNGALFKTDLKNAQIFQIDFQSGGQVAVNADKVDIWGLEADLIARPTPELDLNISMGYTDAELTDFNGTGQFDGNRMPNVPKFTFNAGMQYTVSLKDDWELSTRFDLANRGPIYFQEDNLVFQPKYTLADAQMTLSGDKVAFTLWIKNLFDKSHATSGYARTISPLIFGTLGLDVVQIDPGRTFGLQLRANF